MSSTLLGVGLDLVQSFLAISPILPLGMGTYIFNKNGDGSILVRFLLLS